jgi:Na+-driven multidrug efflux pump
VKRAARTRQQLFVIGILSLFGLLLVLVLAGQLIQSSESPSGYGSRETERLNPLSLIFGCVLLVGMILLYFVPSVVAFVREHQNAIPILVLNLFFGWTLLGWVICLAWSFSSDDRESRQYIKQVIVKGTADD